MSAPKALQAVEEIRSQIERHQETGWTELDPEAKAFGIAFITTPSPRQAAVEAGLAASRGNTLYKDPVVRAYISFLQDMMAETSIINIQFVQAQITHYLPIFAGEESAPIVVPGVGVMDEKRLHGPELIRLLDMMAKHTGFYNADLSQNSVLQMFQALQEIGRKHQTETEPVDPRSFRTEVLTLVESKEDEGE
jgi:hypothetical protein